MTIRIEKATYPKAWYSSRIGEEFEVIEATDRFYKLHPKHCFHRDGSPAHNRIVMITDAQVVSRKKTEKNLPLYLPL